MFRVEITSLHEFRMFVKIIKGIDITDDEIRNLSQTLDDSSSLLLSAEEREAQSNRNPRRV